MKKDCPICNGKGELPTPYSEKQDEAKLKRKAAKILVDQGYSYRQVCDIIGWKSTRSVSVALGKSS